jgi:repressor LexA
MSATASRQRLTDRQQQVLEWISCYLAEREYGPSIREIAHAHGWTPHGAHCHLHALRAKGCITWDAGQARSIRITGGEA